MDAREAQEKAERFFKEDRERAIALARQHGALGDVWASYEAEIGPLEAATDADVRHLLEVHAIQAAILGTSPLGLPRRVAELILRRLLGRLQARLRGERRPGRRPKSWRDRRLEAGLIARAHARKAELIAQNAAPAEAERMAARELVRGLPMSATTLTRWMQRRRPK